ncbi:MAG: chemotaxis protein CheW [Gammaproteobacteria bacterium]|nr:chemotaxis protein CheW [Gammaproteobacteria bacterium]
MIEFETDQAFLIFRVGSTKFCVPAGEVKSIIQPPKITKIPLMPFYVYGTFNFRGHVASALSIRKKLGLGGNDDFSLGQLIVSDLSKGTIGFWVDMVEDIVDASQFEWADAKNSSENVLFEHYAIHEGNIILYTNFSRLFDIKHQVLQKSLEQNISSEMLQTANIETPMSELEQVAKEEPDLDSLLEDPTSDDDVHENNQVLLQESNDQLHEAVPENVDVPISVEDSEVEVTLIGLTDEAVVVSDELEQNIAINSVVHENEELAPPEKSEINSEIDENANGTVISPLPADDEAIQEAKVEHTIETNSSDLHIRSEDKIIPVVIDDSVEHEFPEAQIVKHDESYVLMPENKQSKNRLSAKLQLMGLSILLAGIVFFAAQWLTENDIESNASSQVLGSAETTELNKIESQLGKSNRNTELGDSSQGVNDKSVAFENENFSIQIERASTKNKNISSVVKKETKLVVNSGVNRNSAAVSETTNVMPQQFVHKVQSGDTLWHIAKQYLGDPFLYPELARINKIKNPDIIYPGDTVRILRKK